MKHDNQKLKTPSLLLRVGRSLESLAGAKRATRIHRKDQIMINDARNFLELHKEEWAVYVAHAMACLQEKKDNVPEALPMTSYLGKLQKYLITEIKTLLPAHMDGSTSEMSSVQWSWLQRATVARIITFNARRGGEPSKLLIKRWENVDAWKRTEDAWKTLMILWREY